MPHLVSHQHASRLAFLHCVLTEHLILVESVRDTFPSLTITPELSTIVGLGDCRVSSMSVE